MDCFHCLALVNNAAMNMGIQVSVQVPAFTFLWYIPRSGIAGSNGNSMFNFLKNHHTFFPQWIHHFTSPPVIHRFPVSPHFRQYLLFSGVLFVCLFFFIIATLMGVKWYIIVVWICISLMISDVEHFLI